MAERGIIHHTPTTEEVSDNTEPAFDRDDVAKVLCRLEGRHTGRSLDEVVAPGIELWTRHRYEAEQLIDELRPLLAAHDAEVFNAGLSRAAEIADQYAEEAREYRDNETDYPESWVGMQHHGMYHGAQDVAIRIRRMLEQYAQKGDKK